MEEQAMKGKYSNRGIEVVTVAAEPMLAAADSYIQGGNTKYNYNDYEDSEKEENFTGFGDYDGDVL